MAETDLYKEKETIARLKMQQEELDIIFNSVPAIIFYKDRQKRLIRVNDAYEDKIGLSREEVYMKKDIELFPEDDVIKYNKDDDRVIYEGKVIKNIIEKIETTTGPIWVRTDKVPYRDARGNIKGLIGISIDITEIKNVEEKLKKTNIKLKKSNNTLLDLYEELSASEEELRSQNQEIIESRKLLTESEEKYKQLIENSQDLIYNLDKEGNILSVNRAFEKAFGLPRREIVGENMGSMLSDREFYENCSQSFGEVMETGKTVKSIYEYNNQYGEKITYDLTLIPVYKEGQISNIIGTSHDITELITKEKKIKKLAYIDQVTGIYNRTYFKEKAIEILKANIASNINLAFFFIDLDNFKKINDTQGHKIGDLVLKEIAVRIDKVFKNSMLFCRMGGDEFAVIFEVDNEREEINQKARELLEKVKEPCKISGLRYYLSCSIGISLFPEQASNYEDLLQFADTAMYEAKAANKNTYRIFDKEMMQKSERKLELETQLRYALHRDEMDIHYQPIIESHNGKIVGFEALMRWESIIFDKVPPYIFIPILEESGLIISYGEWIMAKACKQIKQWQQKYNSDLYISINVSPIQLKEKDFAKRIRRVLQESKINANDLEIEITESIFIDDLANVIKKLKELQDIGVKVAIDDFGKGYSSLNYLRILPINKIKIDKIFVDDIVKENKNRSILGSMIALAHDMQLKVVAEGVENKKQKLYIENKKCDYMQGYYFSRPCKAEDIHLLF